MKRVAIVQSNYIPWKGYFDMIASVDEFILYDDMQYTRNDWRNRNQIKTPQGVQWLTMPVLMTGRFGQTIRETEIKNNGWAASHWKTLSMNYRRARYFDEVAEFIAPVYERPGLCNLSQINRIFIEEICAYLGISTKISNSWDYLLGEGKTERVVDLCLQAGGTDYISGPAAKEYIVEDVFTRAGVGLHWFDYSGYPAYPQLWGEFSHGVSILDLLFNCGKNAPLYMKYVRHSEGRF